MSAEQAARSLGIRFEIGRDWNLSLEPAKLSEEKQNAFDDVPKKPMSQAGASSNAPDASASTPMALCSVTALPLWPLFDWLPTAADDGLD